MKKILVIEDNQEVRENLQEILELSGYNVIIADDGKEGVVKAVAEKPQLILCDVMMPKLDGFGVLNILSKKSETSSIPFIFLTAKAEKTDFRRGMNLGADDYITKPFFKDELLEVLETRLAKTERLQHQFDKTESGLKAFIDEAKGLETLKNLTIEKKLKLLKKRDLLFEEGEYPRYLYFINEGKLKIFKTNEDGKEYIIDILGPGSFIGYTDLLKGLNHSDSAAAIDDSSISQIPREDFFSLVNSDWDVASQLFKMLADNVASKEDQLLQLAYNSVRKRVADALLLLYVKENEPIQILRDDLARIVGTAKESVIRMLTEFKEDGHIEIKNGVIFIKDPEKLRNIPS
jgi:CheY-like chemotaxis protein/CRP-like cAMP-binding protein